MTSCPMRRATKSNAAIATRRHAFARAAASCVVVLALAGVATAREKLPEVTHDGLHLVKGTGFEAFYLEPGASLAGYREVEILDCYGNPNQR